MLQQISLRLGISFGGNASGNEEGGSPLHLELQFVLGPILQNNFANQMAIP